MKHHLILILIIFTLAGNLLAQDKIINLEDIFKGKYSIENIQNPTWKSNSKLISYIQNDSLKIEDPSSRRISCFITLEQLKKEMSDISVEIKYFPRRFQFTSDATIVFQYSNSIYSLEKGVNDFKVVESKLKEGYSVLDIDISTLSVIYKNNSILYYQKIGKEELSVICSDTASGVVLGESVHRSEWGINKGTFFSPGSKKVAYYRMDESMVEDYPLVKMDTSIAKLQNVKYPMAGKTSHKVQIGIFNSEKKNANFYLKTDINDGEYLTNIAWDPNEQYIYIAHVNREQNHMKLIQYSVETGEKQAVLFEEHNERYVEPNHPIEFTTKTGEFVWQSRRDGWNHLYLYNVKGQLIKQLTKGEFEVTDYYGCDANSSNFYFQSTQKSPIERHIYTVNRSGKITALTNEAGEHSALFNPDKSLFVDYFNSLEVPNKISIVNKKGQKVKTLLESSNPYAECKLGDTEILQLKNKNGDVLYSRLIKPIDFDENKKYPCLVYVYGGPHSQLVSNSFMNGGVFLHYLAQKGYVIFTLDNRGTNHRGFEFESCIHRQLGTLEIEDQMCGIEYLKQQSWIDTTRIGLDGWSYGGFMVTSLITTHPDVFVSATCGGPVTDWKWYEIMYGERYMDSPQENPEGYAGSSVISKVKNLKTKLLIFHGALDATVVWQHSLMFLNEAIRNNIDVDYFVYPNHEHNVRGKDRLHLWKKIENFHELYLKRQ